MSDSDRLRLLRGHLEEDHRFISLCAQRHTEMVSRAAHPTDDEMAAMAVAYLLHNLYTAFEGYFFRIAKCFENSIDDASWHRELIERMKIEVPGIRPAIIDAELEEQLDELRRFRHLFRNLYKSQLKPHRVQEVSGIADTAVERFYRHHIRLIAWIDDLLRAEADS